VAEDLPKIEHWPEKNYPAPLVSGKNNDINDVNQTVVVSLMQALQIGAGNSMDYQTRKEKFSKPHLTLNLNATNFATHFSRRFKTSRVWIPPAIEPERKCFERDVGVS
jgi:hypothetical protein